MAEKWCARCRANRTIEWEPDIQFGPQTESARCPACGTVWGTRARRRQALESWLQQAAPLRSAGGPPAPR